MNTTLIRHRRTAIAAACAAAALSATPAHAAPAGDDLSQAVLLPAASTVTAPYTTVGANREAGELTHAPAWAGQTVWRRWVPAASGGVFARTCGSAAAPYSQMEIYKGPANATHAGLVELQKDSPWKYPTCEGASQKFMAVAGTSYYFVMDYEEGGTAGAGQLEIVQETDKPVSTFVDPPAVSGPKVTIKFKANAGTVEPWWTCRLDGGALEDCGKEGYTTLTGLTSGQHTLEVRATDWYGNQETSFKKTTFTVDAEGAETQITSPAPDPYGYSASFTFSSPEAPVTFVCTQDGSKPFPCTTPYAWKNTIWDGEHTFTAAAVDKWGNVDPTPVVVTWTAATPQQNPKPPVAPTPTPVPSPSPSPAPSPEPGPGTGTPPPPRCPVVVSEVVLRRMLLGSGWRVHVGACRSTVTVRLGRRTLARTPSAKGMVRLRLRGGAARAVRRARRTARLTVVVRSIDADGGVHRVVRRPRLF